MPPAVPLVDATDIIRLVGPGAFDRAKGLVREHAVLRTEFDAEALELTGAVRGSEPVPYEVSVTLARTRGESARATSSSCACFVGSACKHVAAVLLQSNSDTITSQQKPVRSAATAAASSWKDALDALAGSPSRERAVATPMGLLFELRERTRSQSARWGAEQSRAGSAASAAKGATFRLGIRPVTQSRTGNWVRGDLTWTTLPFSLNRLAASPEQHRWFGQFQALHKSARDAYVPGDSEWLFLDDFASPLLWPLLAEGARLGITFVTGKREVDVVVAEQAAITIDVASAGTTSPAAGAVRAPTPLAAPASAPDSASPADAAQAPDPTSAPEPTTSPR